MTETNVSCEKCERYMRVVDRKGKTRGYVCDDWLNGIVGTGIEWSPCGSCFVERKYRNGKTEEKI